MEKPTTFVSRVASHWASVIRHFDCEAGIALLFCPSFSLPSNENRQSGIHEREGSKGKKGEGQRRALGG